MEHTFKERSRENKVLLSLYFIASVVFGCMGVIFFLEADRFVGLPFFELIVGVGSVLFILILAVDFFLLTRSFPTERVQSWKVVGIKVFSVAVMFAVTRDAGAAFVAYGVVEVSVVAGSIGTALLLYRTGVPRAHRRAVEQTDTLSLLVTMAFGLPLVVWAVLLLWAGAYVLAWPQPLHWLVVLGWLFAVESAMHGQYLSTMKYFKHFYRERWLNEQQERKKDK